MDENFFLNQFADVDILKVEAVGEVIGRFIAKLTKGMVDAGLSEEVARRIIDNSVKSLWLAMLRSDVRNNITGEPS